MVGISLVVFARSEREASAEPRAGEDHWHAAYGVYVCDAFQPPLSDAGPDTLGIHTHTDGIVHIHPFLNGAAGSNAKYGVFFDMVGLTLDNSKLTLPDGTAYEEGTDTCGVEGEEEDGRLVVARWAQADEALDGKEPSEIITENFDGIRFRADCEAFTVAFVPEGADIPAPESIPTLGNLSDVVGTDSGCPGIEGEAPTSSTTSTTVADGTTDSTVGDGTTDSTVGDTTSSTVAETTTTTAP